MSEQIVSITEAAKLIRRGRASMYRDINKGVIHKTVSATGEAGIELSELVRVYGTLYDNPAAPATDQATFGAIEAMENALRASEERSVRLALASAQRELDAKDKIIRLLEQLLNKAKS